MDALLVCLPLLIGWSLDILFGDPYRLPHPIVGFGKLISFCNRNFNRGNHRRLKGAICSIALILSVYVLARLIIDSITHLYLSIAVQSIVIFYCLSGTTLIREVRGVFKALNKGIDAGRRQVARIVGRDTMSLSRHEVQTAALETLAENLSDGVVAPLFWYAILGVPGMLAYKMINTLDSMIGYRNEKYLDFGCVAARIDDVANYLPARITAILMLVASFRPKLLSFVNKYGSEHLSPNSGYPEAALAGILDCRFGGPHNYFGQQVDKPYIGCNHRELDELDMLTAVSINRKVECLAIFLVLVCQVLKVIVI